MKGLRRSLLFVPGTRPERIAKAAVMAVDGVILDLEDAVPPAQKAQAREWVVAALRRVDFGARERIVRVNAPGTPEHAADLAAVIQAGPDALLLPKLADASGVARLDAEVARIEQASGCQPGGIRFHLLVETVAAVVGLEALARAVPRSAALFYGAGDLARETRARLVPGRLTELYTMSRVVLVARATGLDAIDSPCFELGQAAALESHTRIGAELGFDGKALIHPSQIEVANRCYTPSPEAIAEARRVLTAYEAAEGSGRGALALEGHFVDAVHVHMARETLARAQLAGVLL
ncbi:MAG TPA: CoA ester lyase [Methylomirabilota bacterium]|jgi:citrate lyase subunit beta/citryl-CoA lyase|nr:CoA ester lyase [Methylomirabilota bacterium]